MPAAVVAPAAIAAGGTLGSALLGSRSAGKAADQQARANREALDWEKQRYGAALNPYNRDRQRWEAGQNYLLQRYGINIPGYGAYTPVQMPQGRQPFQPRPGNATGQAMTQAVNGAAQAVQAQPRQTLGSLLNAPVGILPQLLDRVL